MSKFNKVFNINYITTNVSDKNILLKLRGVWVVKSLSQIYVRPLP